MSKITKECIKCKCSFPLTEEYFFKRKDSKDGFANTCKGCKKEQSQRYYAENKESHKQRCKQYYENHKDDLKEYYKQWASQNKEHLRDYQKKYCEEHKEHKAEYDKEWNPKYYIKNKDKILQYHAKYYQKDEVKDRHRKQQKEWRKDNPDKVQIYKLKRRTLEKELPSTLTPKDWTKIKDYFDNKCAYCGREIGLTLDHFIPLTKLGELSLNNSIPACRSCNSSKGAKDFFEWYPKHRHYSKKREKAILSFLGYANQDTQQPMLLI